MKVGSTFSGIEGFGLGLGAAGMELAWMCENNPVAQSILRRHFPTHPIYDDITVLKGSEVEPIDLLCGGSPCQDLSVAGQRRGLAGRRSGLFFEFARLLEEIQPEWFVFENVPGLFSSNNGEDFRTVLSEVDDLGYGVAWRVLDSRYFGVPQRRRRVFIVGHLGDVTGPRQVLLERTGGGGDPSACRHSRTAVAPVAASGLGAGNPRDNAGLGRLTLERRLVHPDNGIVRTVTSKWAKGSGGPAGDECQNLVSFHLTQTPITSSEVYPALGCGNRHGCATVGVALPVAFSENQRAEVVETPYAHQLTTGGGKPGQGYPAIRLDYEVRRLTPEECERLQGFPTGWTALGEDGKPIPDSRRYACIGNAVTVPVVRWIGEGIMEAAVA